MTDTPVTKIHTIETEKTSRFQKIKTFAKKNKTPLLLTVTAVSGLAAGYVLRDKAPEILGETSNTFEAIAVKIEDTADNITDQTDEK